MIDIHSHILPGIDDGAKNFEQALDMLAVAIKDGVTTQVLTPHIHPDRYNNNPYSIMKAFRRFKGVVKEHNLPINLHLSAEVRIGPDIIEYITSEDFPWLGSWNGKKVFLLEFPSNCIPAYSINLVKWFIAKGRLPMIVHPERNLMIQEDPEILTSYINEGCLLQITSGSLISAFGEKSKKTAIYLLREGLVTLIGSDCHNLAYRPPNLSKGLDVAKYLIGKDAAEAMVTTIPAAILTRNKEILSIKSNSQNSSKIYSYK